MSGARRRLCAEKNARSVACRARLACLRLGHRCRKSQNSTVSRSSNQSSACGKYSFRVPLSRLVIRVLSPTRRRRCSTSVARVRMSALCGCRGCNLSRCRSNNSRAIWASVGSSLARLGTNASRYLASVAGLTGNSTMNSCRCRACTSGPLAISRQTAIGPPKRRYNALAHSVIASGECTSTPNSRCDEPAACKQKSCFRSDQSIPTKAVNDGSIAGFTGHLRTQYIAERGMHAWVLRSQYREPVRRQALSIRCRTQAHPRARIQSGKHRVFGSSYS